MLTNKPDKKEFKDELKEDESIDYGLIIMIEQASRLNVISSFEQKLVRKLMKKFHKQGGSMAVSKYDIWVISDLAGRYSDCLTGDY